jgi:type I site-specific restriction endonuclease
MRTSAIRSTYSLGQGIEDGFLATYKVHRIRTNLDKQGGIDVRGKLAPSALDQ